MTVHLEDTQKGKSRRNKLPATDAGYDTLAQTAEIAIFIILGDRFQYANPAAEMLTGYTQHELLQMKFIEMVHPDSHKDVGGIDFRQRRGANELKRLEFKILSKSGKEYWIDFTSTPIDFHGKSAVMATAYDISDRKRTELALHDSEQRYRNLVELSPDAIAVHCEGKISYANPAAITLMGARDASELIGKPVMSFVHPDYHELVLQRIQQTQKESVVGNLIQEKFIRLDGLIIDVEVIAIPMTFEGKPATQVVFRDITDRKQLEILQDTVYRIAEAADRVGSLDELFATIHAMIREVMPANNFYIAMYDRENDLLSFPYFVDELDQPSPPGKPGKGLTEYVLRNGDSLLCDISRHQELERKGEIELVGIQSPIWLGVPLRVQDSVIGVMVLQDYENPAAYSEREKRMLEYVSSRTAMAIHQKRNEEKLRESEKRYRRQAEEFSALFETTRDLTIQPDLVALLEAICMRVKSLLAAKGCAVCLYHDEQNELEIKVAIGMERLVGKHIPLGEGMSGIVAGTQQPLVVSDYQTWEHRSGIMKEARIGAVAMVPMQYSGELLGMMSIYEILEEGVKETRTYNQNDVNLLMFFAGVAASAVHNARLFMETKRRLVELEVLYQTSLASTQAQNLTGIAKRIVDSLEDFLNWHRGSIWLVNRERNKISLLVHNSIGIKSDPGDKEHESFRSLLPDENSGIVGWVCKNGKIIRTGNVKVVDIYIEGDPKVQSELCVPLQVGGTTIGCINVESYELDAFGDEDERLLTTVAGQAAIAIETSRLFEETRQQAARQTALNAIIMAAAQTDLDMSNYLDLALEHTLEALELSIGAVWLLSVPTHLRRVATRGVSNDLGLFLVQIAGQQGTSMKDTVVIKDWAKKQTTLSRDIITAGIRSSITVPMLSGGHRIGGLSVASTVPREWTAEEIALVEAVGREVGTFVERAGLFLETRARLSELETVNRVSIASRLAHSLNEMLPDLIDDTLPALKAEAGSIWLFDPDLRKLIQVVGRGWDTSLSSIPIDAGDGILGTVFASGDVYFANELQSDPLALAASRELAPPGWGAMCVPIRAEQEIIGVFLVSSPPPREFSPDDARLMVTLSEIAGNAIHRMRLFEQIERHAAELEERVAERTVELQKALQRAQVADRMKSEFIANMNHELRTPLTNMVLYYQMLRTQPLVQTEERLDVIGRELGRLRQLIEALLSLSRLDLGQTVLKLELHNLNRMIQTLVDDRHPLAENRVIKLETNLDDLLPDAWLDEQLLMQVISNLLTNALNYTPAGGRVAISTFTVQDGTYMVGFSVQDNGPGINEDDFPHLFDRFYRGKAAQISGAQGTGLGLAIVKSVVDRHQGRIEVENVPQGGAKFTVWLPLKQEEEAGK